MMTIRRMVPTDAAAYRELMLAAYERHPEAFTTTSQERGGLPLSWWETRLRDTPDADTVMIGAFSDGQLAGVMGVTFEHRDKLRHKSKLIGLYVDPAFRGHGLSYELGRAVLDAARARPGVKLIQATLTQGNEAVEKLNARLGFVTYGVEPHAVDIGGTFVTKLHQWCNLSDDLPPVP